MIPSTFSGASWTKSTLNLVCYYFHRKDSDGCMPETQQRFKLPDSASFRFKNCQKLESPDSGGNFVVAHAHPAIGTSQETTMTSRLFDRITTCFLAMQHVMSDVRCDNSHRSCYEEVMKSISPAKITKHKITNVTRACVEFITGGFSKRVDHHKIMMIMCVIVSIADGRD